MTLLQGHIAAPAALVTSGKGATAPTTPALPEPMPATAHANCPLSFLRQQFTKVTQAFSFIIQIHGESIVS